MRRRSGSRSSISRPWRTASTPTSPSAATSRSSRSSRHLVQREPLRERPQGSSHAGPLPIRPAGRGARALPEHTQDVRRRARDRAHAETPRARGSDPPPRSGPRGRSAAVAGARGCSETPPARDRAGPRARRAHRRCRSGRRRSASARRRRTCRGAEELRRGDRSRAREGRGRDPRRLGADRRRFGARLALGRQQRRRDRDAHRPRDP